jgi:hypothetical protein
VGRSPWFSAKASGYDLSKILISFIFGAAFDCFRSDENLNRSTAHSSSGSNWGGVPTGVRLEKGNSQ